MLLHARLEIYHCNSLYEMVREDVSRRLKDEQAMHFTTLM